MDILQWFLFFLAVQVIHFAGTWRLYEKAGRKRWEALVPVYNAVILMHIIRRSPWWTILLFVPIVNLIMFPVVWVQILKAFGKTSTMDYILGVVTLGLYIFVINYDDKVKYNGEIERTDSTISSLLFAIVVATIVHTYVMQPFTIPTASLEKTLLIGDFLFVSKFHYGARTPMTTVAAPMVHDSIPVINTKSYRDWPQLPYFRLPGFQDVSKNDIVVFNWPVDTVKYFGDHTTVGLRKPVDKKSNYVKRCVGTPGDVFSLRDGIVYINGQELKLSDRAEVQYVHKIYAKDITGVTLQKYGIKNPNRIYRFPANLTDGQFEAMRGYMLDARKDMFGNYIIFTGLGGIPQEVFDNNKIPAAVGQKYNGAIEVNMTLAMAEELRKTPGIESVERSVSKEGEAGRIFPHSKPEWNVDNIGDIYIPEKGKSVRLTAETLPFYKMIIKEYEKNTLEVNGSEIKINGKPETSYTFKQNYYWMMGDNRHNSEDSRYWGFVPEDHIVGKPVFIWMSLDQNEKWGNIKNKVRWDRMFTTVGGDGAPVSYFKYFLIALVGWFAFDFFRKRKNKAAK
ncbi:MAG: signal peptidase I [Bacteroidota bacterium]